MGKKAEKFPNTIYSNKKNTISENRESGFSQSLNSPIDHRLMYQRAIGNQGIQRLSECTTIQEKLQIGKPNDYLEQKSDRLTEAAIGMSEPPIQRKSL